jgi:hypothetical protein
MKESKLKSNVNWPGVLEEDGIKQALGVLPFPNPKHTCIMASSLPLDLHLNGWNSLLLQPYISVTLCCIPIS